jgi:hypothetical protein
MTERTRATSCDDDITIQQLLTKLFGPHELGQSVSAILPDNLGHWNPFVKYSKLFQYPLLIRYAPKKLRAESKPISGPLTDRFGCFEDILTYKMARVAANQITRNLWKISPVLGAKSFSAGFLTAG